MNNHPSSDLWQEPDLTTLRECAAENLRGRLELIGGLLGHESRTSIRQIHRMRIELRRVSIALRLFAPVLNKKRSRRLQKMFKSLRSSFGPLRESDVFLQRCFRWCAILSPEEQAILALAISRKRFRVEKKVLMRLDSGNWGRIWKQIANLKKLLLQAHTIRNLNEVDWTRKLLGGKSDQIQRASERGLSNIGALHQMRIDCRFLRYALELVEECQPSGMKPLILDFKKAQVDLGEIHDALEIIELLGEAQPKSFGLSSRSIVAIIESEQTFAREKKETLLAWWQLENPADRLNSQLATSIPCQQSKK